MKATKISVHLLDKSAGSGRLTAALLAAFSPFGSLTEGVDGQSLAEMMTHWVNAKAGQAVVVASELIGLVRSATTDQLSSVELGSWEVVLRTPTSGTRIRLHHYASGYDVEVDFGPNGSKSRAMTILAAAERGGVRMDVYNGQHLVKRDKVLGALRGRAAFNLEWLEDLPPGYYTPEYRAEATARAREEVAFFKKATA